MRHFFKVLPAWHAPAKLRAPERLFRFGTGWLQSVTALLLAQALSAAQACPSAAGAPLQALLPGIAVRHEHWLLHAKDSRPHWASSVVLWQGRRAVVLDPGATRCSGLQLQRAMDRLAGRRLKVDLVINSHAHAEQVLANSAWSAPVAALMGTQAAMQQRCPDCLASLTQDLGTQALRGTRIVQPGQVLRSGQVLQAGGRQWQVLDMPLAHTQNDLLLWSSADGVLLAGGLLDGQRLVLAQGRVTGWLQALERMAALQPRWLIGQHLVAGPGEAQAAIERQRQALCELVRRSWQGLEQWQTEAQALADLPREGTAADQRLAGFNLARAWREMEVLWLGQEPMPQACAA